MLIHFKHICVRAKEERFSAKPGFFFLPGENILCGLSQPPANAPSLTGRLIGPPGW